MRIGPWPSTSVKIGIDKAQTKLRKIRGQLTRDQENWAARVDLLTAAAKRLSAAIIAARSMEG
ncbi:hypothetical protein XF30_21240 [Bradyrhizobium sp. SUTN9-2]|nr:hypothetical protein XF30_21240 [Bradyrhizobium sp. SUTN9-2]